MDRVHMLHMAYCTAPAHIASQGGAWSHPRFPNHHPEDDLFQMDDPAVLRMVREVGADFLEQSYPGLPKSLAGTGGIVPHQASKLGPLMPGRFGWPEQKIVHTLEMFGNCVGVSIPVTLYQLCAMAGFSVTAKS